MNPSSRLCSLLVVAIGVVVAHAQPSVAPGSPRRVDPRQPTPRHAYSPFDAAAQAAQTPARPVDFNPARIVIKLKPEALNAALGSSQQIPAAPLAAPGLGTLRRVFPSAEAPVQSIPAQKSSTAAANPEPAPPDLRLWMQAEVTPGTDVLQLIETLKQNSAVATAEPDILFRLSDEGVVTPLGASTPTRAAAAPSASIPDGTKDPLMASQWHLDTAKVKQAWAHLQSKGLPAGGNRDIVIAVIDSGVDYTHPDLAANMWVNSREIPGNGIDDDGNGIVDDVHGASFVGNSYEHKGNPMDDNGHGTHVAGIIAAAAGNGIGGVGIAYNCQIMAIKAAQYSGVLSSTDIAEAIYYAVEKGADVINMSFGGPAQSLLVEDALAVAFGQAVLVASAGNAGKVNLPCPLGVNHYPAAYNWVLGVMASDASGKKAAFSNYDCEPNDKSEYEIYAPGVGIMSTLPGNQYAAWSGTSMSAPVVSGIAALLRTKFADKDVYSSRFIMGQVVSTGPQTNVDAFATLTSAPKPKISYLEGWLFDTAAQSQTNDNDGIVDAGETLDLAIVIRNQWGKAENVVVKLEAQADGAVKPDPYVSFQVDTVNYGAVGSFNWDDNGLIYDAQGVITGVRYPFRFMVAVNTPNDHVIPFKIRITCTNGFDPNDPNAPYTFESRFDLIVQKGRELPRIISQNMTLTKDSFWLVAGQTLIESGATVTVTEGTQIQWGKPDPNNPYGSGVTPMIEVQGALRMLGTQQEPIELFPSAILNEGRGKVRIDNHGTFTLSYSRVCQPEMGLYGLYYGPNSIDHCYFYGDKRTDSGLNSQRTTNSIIRHWDSTNGFSLGNADVNLLEGAYGGRYYQLGGPLTNCVFLQNNRDNRPWSLELQRDVIDKSNLKFYFPDVRDGKTYVAFVGLTLPGAEVVAQHFGGHVVSVQDQQENDYLRNYIATKLNYSALQAQYGNAVPNIRVPHCSATSAGK